MFDYIFLAIVLLLLLFFLLLICKKCKKRNNFIFFSLFCFVLFLTLCFVFVLRINKNINKNDLFNVNKNLIVPLNDNTEKMDEDKTDCSSENSSKKIKQDDYETIKEDSPIIKEINHYTCRTDKDYYLKNEERLYLEKLIDAILEQQERVQLTNDYDANLRILGAGMENPYWFFVKSDFFSEDHTTIFLEYNYSFSEQKEMQTFMDEEFLNIINTNIESDMNETDQLMAIHKYFGERIHYNYEWLDGFYMSDEKYLYPDIAIYEALKTNKGVCHTYTYLCEFALRQLGIECLQFTDNKYENEEEGHMWYIAKIDGEFYHFDTTWDSHNQYDKVGLLYFGMSDEERKGDCFDLDYYDFDSSYQHISCKSNRFQNLRDIISYDYIGNHQWNLISDSGKVYIYNSENGEKKQK